MTVKFDERAVSFRVTTKYTFDDLLADAAEYWSIDKNHHRLTDGQSIWCVAVVSAMRLRSSGRASLPCYKRTAL